MAPNVMRILIADKDQEIVSLVAARLRPRHYEVMEATSSELVLRYLRRESFDLALISTELERIDGKHLIEKIREQPYLSTLPIVMIATEDEISELILGQERGFDDFLIKPFSPLALQLRVGLNISRTRIRAEANALTQLPGNIVIEKTILSKIENEEKFSVLYIDINHFKSFNDHYSFSKGDDAIRQTAKLLLQTQGKICPEGNCFIGHIGGDDFIVVLSPEKEERYARHFISEFDRIMPTCYSEADQKKGFIEVTNRRGERESFPLISCAVAACTNLERPYRNIGEIARDAAEVKTFLKSQPGSHYLRNRRASPLDQLDQAADLLATSKNKKKTTAVEPLGRILLHAGLIDEDQLSRAVKQHMLTGQRLGQTMISMNLVQTKDVGRMLEKKLNVPYVSLKDFTPSRDVTRLFTFDFIKSHRVVPLEIAGKHLKLAMCDPFDLKTLDAIESITGYAPIPCLALEGEFEAYIESRSTDRTEEQMAS